MKHLQRLAVSSVKWSAISQAGRQVMQLLTTVILARLLSPSDFGLMGMVVVVTGFIMIFKDLGTSAAVIQRKNLSNELLNSIFWINMAFGFLVMILLITMAPLVAAFYHEPRVTPILRALSVTFFISSLGTVRQALLERDLAFRQLAIIEICAVLSGSIIGVVAALKGAEVWSLVYQSLMVTSVTTIILLGISPFKSRIIFRWHEIVSVSHYSMNLTGYNIFNYFTRNADYLLIGRFLGAQDLGFYTLAYNIMLYPLQHISYVIGRVMFPLFSQIQHDERFQRAYLQAVGAISIITFPAMLGVWIVAEPFVLTLFGFQWQPVVLLLMILAPVGMIQSVGTTVGTIYQAKGRTDWMFRWGIFAGILAVSAIVIGIRWGIVGVAAAYAIASLVLFYPNFAIPLRLINLSVRSVLAAVWRPASASLIMAGTVLLVLTALPADQPWLALATTVPVGVTAYAGASCLINRDQVRFLRRLITAKL